MHGGRLSTFIMCSCLVGLGVVYACGTDVAGGDDAAADVATDSVATDGGASDAPANDAADMSDVTTTDAADAGPCDACSDYVTSDCDGGCPTGTACVTRTQGLGSVSRCYPVPTCCNGTSLCDCIGACTCGTDQCTESTGGITCSGGAVSRRAFKTDIRYVDDAERRRLASEALETRLASYRYKVEAADAKRHLGFIIDDTPPDSVAVQGDRTHVDLYGYASMLLAAVQEQQREIDELKHEMTSSQSACARTQARR